MRLLLNVMESSMFIGGKVVNDFANKPGCIPWQQTCVFPVPMVQMHCKLP